MIDGGCGGEEAAKTSKICLKLLKCTYICKSFSFRNDCAKPKNICPKKKNLTQKEICLTILKPI